MTNSAAPRQQPGMTRGTGCDGHFKAMGYCGSEHGRKNMGLRNHINALLHYAKHAVVEDGIVGTLEGLLDPRVTIQSAAESFEDKGLSVPKGLAADRNRVGGDIKKLTRGSEVLQVYERVDGVLADGSAEAIMRQGEWTFGT
jgi:hypothetical protein